MEKQFEDAFMDIQAGLISLCIEAVGDHMDKIYAYCSIEKKSRSFNVCFDCGGTIKTLDQMGVDMRNMVQLLRLGTADLLKIRDVCETYHQPVPTEIKMVYFVDTGKFQSNYRYDEICSAKTQKCAAEVFDEWVAEINQCMH